MDLFQRLLGFLRGQPPPDQQLRLYQLMRRRRVFLWDPPSRVEARELNVAMRRCLACRDKERCDELFAAGDAEGHRHFCPNAAYIEGLAERNNP